MLGYIAYVLICAFGFLQLFDMLRGQTRNLGNIPTISLIAGLALLEISVLRDGAPTYIQVGNTFSLIGTTLTFLVLAYYERADRAAADDVFFTLTDKGYAATESD